MKKQFKSGSSCGITGAGGGKVEEGHRDKADEEEIF